MERNAGDFRNDVHHVVGGNEHFLFLALLTPLLQNRIELFLGLFFLVAKRRSFFEILSFDRGFLLESNSLDVLLDFLQVGRTRHRVDAGTRAGLVHDVDCFVRKKTAGDVAIGKFYGGLEGFVGQFRFVMRFVLRTQSFQNLNRFFNSRRIDFHGLKPALESGVFLDVFAILVHRRRTDALQFAAA